ncbi:MAG: autotransporter assembly complex family protein [Pseudomonadota bacterium]
MGEKLPDDIKAQIVDTLSLGKVKDSTQPTTLGQLRRRANTEAEHLNKVLRSQAYFNGRIDPVIEEAQGGRFELTYRVTLGPRTMIESFLIEYADHPSDEATLPHDGKPLGLKSGRAARAQRIIDLTGDALTWLENHGHPHPKLDSRNVIVDMAAHQARVTLIIIAGPPQVFGALAINNKTAGGEPTRTDEAYIQSLATFKAGDLYDRRKADETIAALRQSNLFDQVAIDVAPAPGPAVTPALSLSERSPRSVGGGAKWSSDEGAGVQAFWEHRNLFGQAEKLRTELSIGTLEQSARIDFTKPRFLRPDQSFLATYDFANEDTDAYNELSSKLGVGLLRQFAPQLQGSAGVSFEIYRTEDSMGLHNYRLIGLPLTLRYDGTDDLLDPTEGLRLGGAMTPYGGVANGDPTAFAKFEATGSTYISFGRRPDITLAFRGRYGLTPAQNVADIPGSLRFYAGGGGSVRGYAYQLVGPLDAQNNPVGGRSVVEMSSEARWRVTKTVGLVAFVDAGQVYSRVTPDFSDELQVGAGIGLRYYTPIGPVRADVAMPVNRRHGIDDAVQFYFSLGQAF